MPNESKNCMKLKSSHPREQPVYPFFWPRDTENDEILGRSLNQERKLKYIYLIKSAVNDSPFTKKIRQPFQSLIKEMLQTMANVWRQICRLKQYGKCWIESSGKRILQCDDFNLGHLRTFNQPETVRTVRTSTGTVLFFDWLVSILNVFAI